MSTICAVASPLAVGGISVIRISGEKAFEISNKIFSTTNGVTVEKMVANTCAYGNIISNGEIIDDGVITVFKAPKSFTGEDVCEISCHGGIFVTKKVLRTIIENGAEPALAGEFTKRAFLNGKMSLTQAEAVMDVISAQGDQALRSAVATHEGAIFATIKKITQSLVSILGELSAWVDYPEEDLPDIELETLKNSLSLNIGEVKKLIESYDNGRIFREGIDTAIVGKPNVGKSTLMNMLLGFDRSIVTEIEGTTRDIVEESVRLGEIVLRLSDTAGIHNTDDVVESFGVNLAKKKIENADLVICVFDNSRAISDEDKQIIEFAKNKHSIAVVNKCDLENILDMEFLKNGFERVIEISAKNNSGANSIANAVEDIFDVNNFDASSGAIANERQKMCVVKAYDYLNMALDALTLGETYDAVTVLIDKSAEVLLELSGERATEAVVNDVFSRFCVGK